MNFSNDTINKIISGQKTVLVTPMKTEFRFSLDSIINIDLDYEIKIERMISIYDCSVLSYDALKNDAGSIASNPDDIYNDHFKYFKKEFPNWDRNCDCYFYNFKLIKKQRKTMKLFECIQKLKSGQAIADDQSNIVLLKDDMLYTYSDGKICGGFDINSEGWEILNVMNFTQAIESKVNCIGLLSRNFIIYEKGKLVNKKFTESEVDDIWIKYGK